MVVLLFILLVTLDQLATSFPQNFEYDGEEYIDQTDYDGPQPPGNLCTLQSYLGFSGMSITVLTTETNSK